MEGCPRLCCSRMSWLKTSACNDDGGRLWVVNATERVQHQGRGLQALGWLVGPLVLCFDTSSGLGPKSLGLSDWLSGFLATWFSLIPVWEQLVAWSFGHFMQHAYVILGRGKSSTTDGYMFFEDVCKDTTFWTKSRSAPKTQGFILTIDSLYFPNPVIYPRTSLKKKSMENQTV